MEVILKQDVKGTGKAGDTVKVSDGFARNAYSSTARSTDGCVTMQSIPPAGFSLRCRTQFGLTAIFAPGATKSPSGFQSGVPKRPASSPSPASAPRTMPNTGFGGVPGAGASAGNSGYASDGA